MENTDEDDIKHVDHLLKCVNLLESQNLVVLSSYMKAHTSVIAEKFKVRLPSYLTNEKQSCQYCLSRWTDGNYRLKLTPSKKIKKRGRRLLRKDVDDLNMFGKSFKQYLQFVQKHNKMEMVCKVCHKVSKFFFKKKSKSEMAVTGLEDSAMILSKKKKKKRKSDKFAGLTPVAVQSVLKRDVDTVDIVSDEEGDGECSVVRWESTPKRRKVEKTLTTNSFQTPLGSTSVCFTPSSAESFIPLDSKTSKKPKQKEKLGLVINPYAKAAGKKKKLTQLKKFLQMEEDKVKTPKNNFKSFLSSL